MKAHPDHIGWENGQITAVAPAVYPGDVEEVVHDQREVLTEVVLKLLNFIYRKPWGKVPERRLLCLAIALGCQEVRGHDLKSFAHAQGISRKNASEHLRKIREHFGIEANNFSTAAFRASCRRGAVKRWKK